ncbi:hypothetical protein L6452_03216 [Arctium lappa]|uniref:Uncharacterized protein n=1 Tax=Arctium lappa TaxID=4217 RepID=A0ACB9FLR4_ARCLA|nr:hypothetical protein L6452_03216 [Arctium lappa]
MNKDENIRICSILLLLLCFCEDHANGTRRKALINHPWKTQKSQAQYPKCSDVIGGFLSSELLILSVYLCTGFQFLSRG